ncbi:MAG: MTH938/NDUFAF3 family protein [Candidatus Pacearchaeota archaeon]
MTSTGFGWIKFNEKIYEHDIMITVSSEIVKRNEEELRRKYGTCHAIDASEIEFLLKEKPRAIIFGNGQSGCARLSQGAKSVLNKAMTTRLIESLTPAACKRFDQLREKEPIAAIFHVTC